MAAGDLSKLKLSGSTDGKGIKVTGNGTGSTVTVHTAHATSLDALYVRAYNDDSAAILLTLEMGAATDPDNVIEMSIPGGGVGLIPVLKGEVLTNSLVLKAFAGTVNKIVLYGFVHRLD